MYHLKGYIGCTTVFCCLPQIYSFFFDHGKILQDFILRNKPFHVQRKFDFDDQNLQDMVNFTV